MTLHDLAAFFGADRYAQHSICLTNDPLMLIPYVAGDLTTFVSYFIIGGTLLIKQARSIEFSPTALKLYGAFIFLCGLSHLTEVITLYSGIYRLDVLVTAMMATVSAVTAAFTALEIYGFNSKKAPQPDF
jgi:hypothetical protein